MDQSRKAILIADDDCALADSLALRSRHMGLDTETAYDALSVLKRISERRFDVVCMDVNMPAGNGLCVCEMMASEPAWAGIPVIVLTGSQHPETIIRCHQLCAYYVLKCDDVWSRIEPLLQELLRLDPAGAADLRR
jgi:two-component system chemotaxis response regulator CheY